MQAQISGSVTVAKNQTVSIPFKNNNVKDWSSKIDETGKFKIGLKENAFSSIASRYAYIRILINGFNTLPEYASLSFDDLFLPLNSYANFQSLLNAVPVPNDHQGFYLTDKKKIHLQSQFLSTP
jgi:hypothetical protein